MPVSDSGTPRLSKVRQDGNDTHGRLPLRTCLGCQKRDQRAHLLRLVCSGPDSALVIDREKTLPGRGGWLHPNLQCWQLAKKKRAFYRAFRDHQVQWQQLERQIIEVVDTAASAM